MPFGRVLPHMYSTNNKVQRWIPNHPNIFFLQATAEAASHLLLALIKDTAQRSYVPIAAISLVIMRVRICTLHENDFFYAALSKQVVPTC